MFWYELVLNKTLLLVVVDASKFKTM